MAVHRLLDPTPVRSLDDHRAAGGLRALDAARSVEPEAVIATITDSGLRGRGGAGFPTGRKWATVVENAASSQYAPTVVVNAAEGEPGTFGDRTLIRRNPYRVLEGALVAAHAVGARSVTVVAKERFALERELLEAAAGDLVGGGFAGDVDIEVIGGPSHYLLGEETALLEAVAGRPPFPRVVPPYRQGTVEIGEAAGGAAGLQLAGQGGIAPPTLVNNVETFAHVAQIVEHGPDWFREAGTPESPGTSMFTVSGDVEHGGVGEFPLGTPVGEIIDALGGKPTRGEIAFVLSGVANGALLGDRLDTPTTHDAMAAAGAGLGTGGFMAFGVETDPVAVAHGVSHFLAVESCGQCVPCKHGGLEVAELLDRLRAGDAQPDAVEVLRTRVAGVPEGARCDLGRQHERVVASLLEHFPGAGRAHAVDGLETEPVLIAPIADIDEEGIVHLDDNQAAKLPGWEYGGRWNGQTPAERFDVSVTIR
jgi:NADH-quinone oxidoreductase subunit F